MLQRRSFVTLTLNPEKAKLLKLLKLLLRKIKSKHKYSKFGENSIIKINW